MCLHAEGRPEPLQRDDDDDEYKERLGRLQSLLREFVDWDVEEQRLELLRRLDPLLVQWTRHCYDVLGLFQEYEIPILLRDAINCQEGEPEDLIDVGRRFIEFVLRSGYRDRPDCDAPASRTPKPFHRITPLHLATGCCPAASRYLRALFELYPRLDLTYADRPSGLAHLHLACINGYRDLVARYLDRVDYGVDHRVLRARTRRRCTWPRATAAGRWPGCCWTGGPTGTRATSAAGVRCARVVRCRESRGRRGRRRHGRDSVRPSSASAGRRAGAARQLGRRQRVPAAALDHVVLGPRELRLLSARVGVERARRGGRRHAAAAGSVQRQSETGRVSAGEGRAADVVLLLGRREVRGLLAGRLAAAPGAQVGPGEDDQEAADGRSGSESRERAGGRDSSSVGRGESSAAPGRSTPGSWRSSTRPSDVSSGRLRFSHRGVQRGRGRRARGGSRPTRRLQAETVHPGAARARGMEVGPRRRPEDHAILRQACGLFETRSAAKRRFDHLYYMDERAARWRTRINDRLRPSWMKRVTAAARQRRRRVVARAPRVMINRRVSLYNLLRKCSPTERAATRRRVTYEDYYEFACSSEFLHMAPRGRRKPRVALHLCEIMSRSFFSGWAVKGLMRLTRRSKKFCEIIVGRLTENRKMWDICEAAVDIKTVRKSRRALAIDLARMSERLR